MMVRRTQRVLVAAPPAALASTAPCPCCGVCRRNRGFPIGYVRVFGSTSSYFLFLEANETRVSENKLVSAVNCGRVEAGCGCYAAEIGRCVPGKTGVQAGRLLPLLCSSFLPVRNVLGRVAR